QPIVHSTATPPPAAAIETAPPSTAAEENTSVDIAKVESPQRDGDAHKSATRRRASDDNLEPPNSSEKRVQGGQPAEEEQPAPTSVAPEPSAEPSDSVDNKPDTTVAEASSAAEESYALLASMDNDPDLNNFLDGLSDDDDREADGNGDPKAE